ncbi:MAG: glycosyltransferase family 9 protein [Bdellovibrio sp.]|nr:glycosyltransferase family 9 protein [Bdellovibrio sp.]
MKKVLLIRLDKIGDLICTMCVDQVSFLKDCDVQWAIAKGLNFIPGNADPKRQYLELKKDDSKNSLPALKKFLREFKPNIAVSFQAPWWVSYALWSEGVPVRAGVRSQWHSFLFLNKGLRQRRSLATQHEADYNLDLLLHAFAIEEKISQEKTPILKLRATANPTLLNKHNLTAQNYIVVHPGMAGSALNWPISSYIELIEKINGNTQVVLTGTPADEPWLKDIKAYFKNNPRVLSLQNELNAAELLTVLDKAKAVVVPSTGVAHIAASLGTPVLGLYSPVRVQHPRRWAARGEKVHIFMPEVSDPENVDPDCMAQIKVEDVLKTLASL